ncbi:MAG: putative GNAT family N-acyltransferase [Sphingobacteriales bacterium]|jgi:predicted GNAT family N-acyltransferase
MIQPIEPSNEMYEMRNNFLRPNHTVEECVFPTDDLTDSFHFGYFEGEELAAVGSFHRETYQNDQGLGYRMRGLVSSWEHRNEDFKKKIVEAGIETLVERGADYIWINARHMDYGMFEEMGFKFLSKEFQIENIGRHKVALLKITKNEEE